MKASVVERFNRSLKERIYRYMTRKYIHVDVIDNLVTGYNHTVHSVTKMRPAEVNMFNAPALARKVFGRKSFNPIAKKKDFKFKVGDFVRLSKTPRPFRKSYKEITQRKFLSFQRDTELDKRV